AARWIRLWFGGDGKVVRRQLESAAPVSGGMDFGPTHIQREPENSVGLEIWYFGARGQSHGRGHSLCADFTDNAGGWSSDHGGIFEDSSAQQRGRALRGTRRGCRYSRSARRASGGLGALEATGGAGGNFVWGASLSRLPLSADAQ